MFSQHWSPVTIPWYLICYHWSFPELLVSVQPTLVSGDHTVIPDMLPLIIPWTTGKCSASTGLRWLYHDTWYATTGHSLNYWWVFSQHWSPDAASSLAHCYPYLFISDVSMCTIISPELPYRYSNVCLKYMICTLVRIFYVEAWGAGASHKAILHTIIFLLAIWCQFNCVWSMIVFSILMVLCKFFYCVTLILSCCEVFSVWFILSLSIALHFCEYQL